MVQKVVGSIPISHPRSMPANCEHSTAASIQVFQTWDESSTLSARTILRLHLGGQGIVKKTPVLSGIFFYFPKFGLIFGANVFFTADAVVFVLEIS